MKVVDLFCGCGGFSEGFRQAGFEIVLGVDNWDVACKSFKTNFPDAQVWERDVRDITFEDLPEADVLIGSPPCQEFSSANPYKPKHPDLSMINHFLKLARGNSHYYVGENVPLIRKHINGVKSQSLAAKNFGLWHNRLRVFFGEFPKVKKWTRNPAYFPTPRAANRNTSKQVSLLNRADKPKYQRTKYDFLLSYPWYVSKWIMGFPERYNFCGSDRDKEKQIGNAVCPPVAKAIGEAVRLREGCGSRE